MRNLKKILALVLALMMVLSVMVTASAAYTDADDIKYTEAVEVLSELTILEGKGDNFDPKGTLTRAEAAVIITKILLSCDMDALAVQADALANNFDDTASHWGLDYIKYCASEGIILGNGKGQFNPNGKLTGYQFAKMLLLAAGIGESKDYLGDKTQTWETKVLNAADENGLLAGLSDVVLSKNLTREQAAQMALNALKAGETTKYTYYVVDLSAEAVANRKHYTTTTAPTVYLGKFSDAAEAYMTAAIMNSQDKVYYVATVVKYSGTLLINNFDVTYNKADHDDFGRPGVSYLFNSSLPAAYQYEFDYSEAPVATYTTKVGADQVLAELGSKAMKVGASSKKIADKVAQTWGVKVYGYGIGTPAAAGNLGTSLAPVALAGLTGYNKVVEIYATRSVIDEIVVVETQLNRVTSIDPAVELYNIPELVYIGGVPATYNYDGLELGAYVTFNRDVDGYFWNIENAKAFQGTLTSFTNTGVYTIDGNKFYCDDASVIADLNTKLGVPVYYFLGANTSILGWAPLGATVNGNYAYVEDIKLLVETDDDLWNVAQVAKAQAKVLLADGTYGIYDLAINKYYDGSLYMNINGGAPEFVYDNVGGKTVINQTWLDTNVKGRVFSYAIEGNTITLVDDLTDLTGANMGTTYAVRPNADIAKGHLSVLATIPGTPAGYYYVNEFTSTVMGTDVPGVYTTTVGTSAIDGVAEKENVWVVLQGTYNTENEIVWYVSNIFAPAETVASSVNEVVLGNYVFVSDVYTVTTDVTATQTYTYVGYKADGSVVDVVSKGAELAEGIYVYDANTKGVVGTAKVTTEVEVHNFHGTTVGFATVDSYTLFRTVNADTAIVTVAKGAKFEIGAKVFYFDVNSDTVVDVIFVTAAKVVNHN